MIEHILNGAFREGILLKIYDSISDHDPSNVYIRDIPVSIVCDDKPSNIWYVFARIALSSDLYISSFTNRVELTNSFAFTKIKSFNAANAS